MTDLIAPNSITADTGTSDTCLSEPCLSESGLTETGTPESSPPQEMKSGKSERLSLRDAKQLGLDQGLGVLHKKYVDVQREIARLEALSGTLYKAHDQVTEELQKKFSLTLKDGFGKHQFRIINRINRIELECFTGDSWRRIGGGVAKADFDWMAEATRLHLGAQIPNETIAQAISFLKENKASYKALLCIAQ